MVVTQVWDDRAFKQSDVLISSTFSGLRQLHVNRAIAIYLVKYANLQGLSLFVATNNIILFKA